MFLRWKKDLISAKTQKPNWHQILDFQRIHWCPLKLFLFTLGPELIHPSDNFPICFFYSIRTYHQHPHLTHFFYTNQNIIKRIYIIINKLKNSKKRQDWWSKKARATKTNWKQEINLNQEFQHEFFIMIYCNDEDVFLDR